MFKWFDASEAKTFGESLAAYFMERVPLEPGNRKGKTLDRKKEVVEKMISQLQLYKSNAKPNIYQKAKLANAFKWKLLEAKYDTDFVDGLTKLLMVKF